MTISIFSQNICFSSGKHCCQEKAKTIVEHEKMWGVANGRSERTLKRMQAKGIERIVTCLNHMETKSFSSEVK